MIEPIIVDRFPPDGPCDTAALVAAGPPFVGFRAKLCQGLVPQYAFPDWCRTHRKAIWSSVRFGVDFFEGLYDYVDFSVDGQAQGEFVLKMLDQAGGEMHGTLPLMLDVERGGQRAQFLTKERVIDVTSTIAHVYEKATGRKPTLYTGELSRSLGITDHMGCDRVAVACYGPALPPHIYTDLGWDYPDEWQYVGTDREPQTLAGYPIVAPGCAGLSDLSVLTNRGGLASLKAICG